MTNGTLFLLHENIGLLRQARGLTDDLNAQVYLSTRTGSHLRHILEFYGCFLEGLAGSHIDYDARRRQLSIETDQSAARAMILHLIEALESRVEFHCDNALWVRIEDAQELQDPFVLSSLGRELQTLRSHTVHHFAIIALTLKAAGIEMDADFGVAPSTLRHQRKAAA